MKGSVNLRRYWIIKDNIKIVNDNPEKKHYISMRDLRRNKKFLYCEEYIKNRFKFDENIDYARIRHLDFYKKGSVIELRVYFKERYNNLYLEKNGVFYDRLAF